MIINLLHFDISVKRPGAVSEFQQFEQLLYNRTLYLMLDLFFCIVMTVNVPAFLGVLQQLNIVNTRQQAYVINLRYARCEALNSSGKQISLIVIAQCRVIRTIDLVNIQIVVSLCAVYFFDIGSFAVQAFPCHLSFFIGQQVLDVDNTDSIMRI
ncbi:hypothetical protein D3C73_842590 [compost metagenome]